MNQISNTRLSQEAREQVGVILNHALADEFALSSAARDYHWNVSGPQFRSLHDLFDEQYHQLDEWIERIGERARSLGITAQSGWADLIRSPRFTPVPGAGLSATDMLSALIGLHQGMVERLGVDRAEGAREQGDAVTMELLADLIEFHESTAWMLGELLEDRVRARA